jgi:hypothetical protein
LLETQGKVLCRKIIFSYNRAFQLKFIIAE